MIRLAPLVACSLIASFCAGCYTTHWVHPSQLTKLQDSQDGERIMRGDGHIPDEKESSVKSKAEKERAAQRSEQAQPGAIGPQAAEKLNPPVHRRQLMDVAGDAIDLKPGVKLYAHLLNGDKVGGNFKHGISKRPIHMGSQARI